MKRPAFQFYPGDWRSNSKLRRCSVGARGAWIEIMCVLHDADEYGVVRWPLAELALAAGVPLKLARELVAKGVLKGADSGAEPFVHTPTHAGQQGDPVVLVAIDGGPVWYCSRFVRDEWNRERRGAGTRFTTENQPSRSPTGSPTRRVGERQGDGASSSSSSSSSEKLRKDIPPSADACASPADDPLKLMIDGAIAYLGECGIAEKQARSVIGMTRKHVGDDVACELLATMQQQRIANPAAWLRKAAEARGPLSRRKQADLETRNRKVAQEWVRDYANGAFSGRPVRESVCERVARINAEAEQRGCGQIFEGEFQPRKSTVDLAAEKAVEIAERTGLSLD
jgi:hypothetical protein